MSLYVRPHAWWTPIGLLAVMGPSRKLQRGPPAFCARRRSNVRCSAQRASRACSRATKSGFESTGWNNESPGFDRAGRASILPAMLTAQEARPRARSPFVAAFLSLLFPGLGHAYAGAYQRALAFAAVPVLIIALALGVAVRSDRGELLGWMIDNLGSIFVVNILVFAYRAVAMVDAWRVAAFLNAVRDSGDGRLGRPRVPVSVLSIAGLAAVILTMSVAHVAVARYDLAAQDLANCVFDSSGTATDCSDQGDNTASGSTPPGASDQGAESDEPQVTPQGTANQPVQSQASLPPWNGTDRLNILLLGVD